MDNTTPAARIRAALKAAGYNTRKVTVRQDHETVRVTLKTLDVVLSVIKAIVAPFECVRRCESTGEVLLGGNIYVDVAYDREVLAPVTRQIAEALLAAPRGQVIELDGRRLAITGEAHAYYVCSLDDQGPRLHAWCGNADSVDALRFAAGQLAVARIERVAAAAVAS